MSRDTDSPLGQVARTEPLSPDELAQVNAGRAGRGEAPIGQPTPEQLDRFNRALLAAARDGKA
jgi:hypothetical protein